MCACTDKVRHKLQGQLKTKRQKDKEDRGDKKDIKAVKDIKDKKYKRTKRPQIELYCDVREVLDSFYVFFSVKVKENCSVMVNETANGYFLPNVVPQNVVDSKPLSAGSNVYKVRQMQPMCIFILIYIYKAHDKYTSMGNGTVIF